MKRRSFSRRTIVQIFSNKGLSISFEVRLQDAKVGYDEGREMLIVVVNPSRTVGKFFFGHRRW